MSQSETISNVADGLRADRYDADEWGQYRSLSTLSVVAFVLGVCSPLAFASPLMLVVPLGAVATALLALKGIAASAGNLSGAKLARCGLALAICFAVASFARVKVRDMFLQRQADHTGRQWLSLAAQGRSDEMLPLMTKAAVDKLAPTDPATQPMSFFGGMFATALMRQDPLLVQLTKLRAAEEIRFRLQESNIIAATNPPQAMFRYVAGSAEPQQHECVVVLKRFSTAERGAIWLVDSWRLE